MSAKIGERVRELRKAAGMSQGDLAAEASVEGDIIERMESEDLNPSVAVLSKICSALGTRTGTVLDGAESAGPVLLHRAEETKKGHYAKSNLTYHMLAGKKIDRNMEPSIIDVYFAEEDRLRRPTHEGEEFIYVLEGDVEFRYGNERFNLSTGDSVYYDSIVPHMLNATTKDGKARVLAISYTPFM